MNKNIEEGLFYLLILLTLKIICNLIWIGVMCTWAVIIWLFDLVYVNLKPRN